MSYNKDWAASARQNFEECLQNGQIDMAKAIAADVKDNTGDDWSDEIKPITLNEATGLMAAIKAKADDTALRFEAARFLGMRLVNVIAGVPLFEGTKEQYEKFHRYIGTPTL